MEIVPSELFNKNKIVEFCFLGIARQGFKSAVEVLAEAAVREGKHVYVGPHISAARSMTPNVLTIRFANVKDIPTGIYPISPTGLLISHESLPFGSSARLSPSALAGEGEITTGITGAISTLSKGILMMCTPKPPEAIEYPLDFEGTVATVDAEAIFSERVAVEPAPYGITALGLFVRATDNLISLDAVKQSILEFEHFSQRVRELNVETMQKAYEETKVLRDVKIKGKITTEEYSKPSVPSFKLKGAIEAMGAAGNEPGYAWRSKLPVCDQRKCTCIECLAVYYCPEGAISWKDEIYHVDYNFCKGCGTCARECTEDAITMEDADKVLASLSKAK